MIPMAYTTALLTPGWLWCNYRDEST